MPEQTTNTLAADLTHIAQQTLEPLQVAMYPFDAVTTNFDNEIAQEGAAVSTRLPTLPTFGSLATGYSANAQNVTTTAKTCTLGAVTGAVIGFDDAEMSKTSLDLQGMFINPIVTGVANDAMDDLLALILNAAFSGKLTSTAANFDTDDVVTLANELSADNVPKANRSCVLDNDYIAALLKDNSLLANTYGSRDPILRGTVGQLSGMSIYEYTDIPGNSENLTGFACGKTALLIAARAPVTPANFKGEIQAVTDPESGFTLQLRRWYSEDQGMHYMSGAAMWGVAVGDGSALHRVVSA